MKSTLELPETLANEIKERADREGRSVELVVADLLNSVPPFKRPSTPDASESVAKSLPLMKVRPVQSSAGPILSAQDWSDWIKDIELQAEVERYEEAFGHQHMDRLNT